MNQDLNGQKELCPRLCHLKKGPNGYGFNLHSEKSRPGQFIRSVDPDSPAARAGLRPQDRLVEVTGGSSTGGTLGELGPPPAHPLPHLIPPVPLTQGAKAGGAVTALWASVGSA